MYCKSAAATTQGKAIADAAAVWGDRCNGIAFPVCKRKYQPIGSTSCQFTGERMFGCHIHHLKRKERVNKAGYRDGWVPFEQFWPVEHGGHDQVSIKRKRQHIKTKIERQTTPVEAKFAEQ